MKKDSAISVEKPAEFEDELTALLRKGAQQLLLQAVEAELEVFLERYRQVIRFLRPQGSGAKWPSSSNPFGRGCQGSIPTNHQSP